MLGRMGRIPRFGCFSRGNALLALIGLGCARAESTRPTPSATAHAAASAPSTVPSATSSAAPSPPPPSARPVTTSVVDDKTDAGLPGVVLGELAEVGPAAPATVVAEGVVLITKDDRVLVAPRSPASRPEKARFAAVDATGAAFAPLARGPGIARGYAYWISQGRLVRRGLAGEQGLEVLADDARNAARVTAVDVNGKTAVAFLGRADHEHTSHARLWLEGGAVLDLTPDGAGASSVSLVRAGDHLLATTIDGRSAMTPMHARKIELRAGNAELGPDVVVWVGGPSQGWTETIVGSEGGHAWAHVPIERDMTHFGLASVDLGAEPHMDSDVRFFDYKNGLDLAPVAAAELCGHATVAYVRPTTSAPHSPAELVLVRLDTGAASVVTGARGFAGVSLVAVPKGGAIAYVADGRTWAMGLGCR
jgi:hypothetical protein